jgi:hypothetical protein
MYHPFFMERIEGDLSNTHSIAEFAKEMKEVAMECFRVLKPDHFLRHSNRGHQEEPALYSGCV